jgi:hypothetical protein
MHAINVLHGRSREWLAEFWCLYRAQARNDNFKKPVYESFKIEQEGLIWLAGFFRGEHD